MRLSWGTVSLWRNWQTSFGCIKMEKDTNNTKIGRVSYKNCFQPHQKNWQLRIESNQSILKGVKRVDIYNKALCLLLGSKTFSTAKEVQNRTPQRPQTIYKIKLLHLFQTLAGITSFLPWGLGYIAGNSMTRSCFEDRICCSWEIADMRR